MTLGRLTQLPFLFCLSILYASVVSAQDGRNVALAQPTYDVFELTTDNPRHELRLPLGPSTSMIIDVTSRVSEVNVELIAPSGESVDQTLIERFMVPPGDVPPLGALLFEEGFHAQAEIASPGMGTWTIRVSLPSAAPAALGNITVLVNGGLSVGLTASRVSYQVGEPVVLALLAFRDGAPVIGAASTVHLYRGGVETIPTALSLRDDGQNEDIVAGDGLYSGSISGLVAGDYMAVSLAQIGDETATATTNFEVAPTLARLAGNKADRGIDDNGDGLFEWIAVDVGVTVETAGTYVALASLASGEREINAAGRSVLPAGAQSIEVRFSAEAIRNLLGTSGPWTVSNVRLLPVAASGVAGTALLDHRPGLGQTLQYSLSQLQRPTTIVLKGLTESGIDTNANGLFDLLRASFSVDTLLSGSYTWTGTLRSLEGSPLAVASGQGTLPAGVTTLAFTFDGRPIGASGTDGPYGLFDVAVYGPSGAAALLEEVGTTRAYKASQFEGSQVTFDRLIELVRVVPIFGLGGVPRTEGIRNSLLQKLAEAQQQAADGHVQGAVGMLEAFLHELQTLGDDRILPSDALLLTDYATTLRSLLELP